MYYVLAFLYECAANPYTKLYHHRKEQRTFEMIDRRIGERIKRRREELGLTQEQFAEQLGLTTNYISTIERGASFPRYEKLVAIINGLETSADAIFCDVIKHTTEYRATWLSEKIAELPPEEQQRILEIIELLIAQAKKKK